MLAEYGKLSLGEVLAPSIELADGYPIDAETANNIERWKNDAARVAVLEDTSCCRTRAKRARRRRRGRSSARRTSRRRCASWSRPSGRRSPRASRARTRSRPRTSASTAATSRQEFVRGLPRAGRPHHGRGPREVEALDRGAALHQLPRRRRLQARHLDAGARAAAVAQHPRELRPARDGLQQRELHPHRLPGDESRLRRSRLLLRRPAVSAGGAAARSAVEGLRQGACGDDSSRAQRRVRRARRPVSVPGRHQPVRGSPPRARGGPSGRGRGSDPDGRSRRRRAREVQGGLHARHDECRRGGRGRLAGRRDAERRLDPGGDRRAHRHRREPARTAVRRSTRRTIRST